MMTRFWAHTLGALVAAVALAASATPAQAGYTFTMDETLNNELIFNGQFGDRMLSTDGAYQIDFFWLTTSGHAHISLVGGSSGLAEANHNNSNGQPDFQGLRITRVDAGAFNLDAMTLNGEASIGNLTDFTTGAGTFALYTENTGTPGNPTSISFGGAFLNVNSIVLGDPGRAGGASFENYWDNIQLSQGDNINPTPAPAGIVLFGLGFAGMGLLRKFRKGKTAVV